jgi:hypothetical protein
MVGEANSRRSKGPKPQGASASVGALFHEGVAPAQQRRRASARHLARGDFLEPVRALRDDGELLVELDVTRGAPSLCR